MEARSHDYNFKLCFLSTVSYVISWIKFVTIVGVFDLRIRFNMFH